jgi:hypothetical protein
VIKMSHLPREMSESPDRKLDAGLDETRVEKVSAVDIRYEIDPLIDKRVTRKFDLHILPWLFGIWYAV